MTKQILVVDDEKLIRKSLVTLFQREGMAVIEASNGKEALNLIENMEFSLIILDVVMDDIDGYYIVGAIRGKGIYTPVLFLSGREEESSKILGISLGADDYLTKPISATILLTKANALIRRHDVYNKQQRDMLVCGHFSFSTKDYVLYREDTALSLTYKETLLIKFFMENQNQVFTKEQLYDHVWDQAIIDNNTIMVYIKRLRDKIERCSKNPQYLRTVWGIGYVFGDPDCINKDGD